MAETESETVTESYQEADEGKRMLWKNIFDRNGKKDKETKLQTPEMKKAASIRELVRRASIADPSCNIFGSEKHRYQLNPPVSLEEVRRFEERYHLHLPEEYVFFLTEVGNGGAGPYYGLYPLEKIEVYTEYLESYTEKEAEEYPAFIDKSLTPEAWAARMKEAEACGNEEYDAIMKKVCAGLIVIGTQGCTYDNLLLCKGSENGNIVYIDWNLEPEYGPFFTKMTFLQWYERYFTEIIEDHDVTSYGYRCLKSEEELMNAYRELAESEAVSDAAAALLPGKRELIAGFYRFKKAGHQTVDFLAGLQEPDLDAMRMELLFRFDVSRGMDVFEQLLGGGNPKGAVQCARRMPKQYKDKYYPEMLELLYREGIEEKNRILYFLHDCGCRKAKDIIAFAMDPGNSEDVRKTAVYVVGTCGDKMDYISQLIKLMRGDSYWLAHTALQAAARTESRELLDTYEWMWEKYQSDQVMCSNLKIAFQTNGVKR